MLVRWLLSLLAIMLFSTFKLCGAVGPLAIGVGAGILVYKAAKRIKRKVWLLVCRTLRAEPCVLC